MGIMAEVVVVTEVIVVQVEFETTRSLCWSPWILAEVAVLQVAVEPARSLSNRIHECGFFIV